MPWRTRTCPLPESPWAGVRATRWSAPKSCPSAKTKGTVNKQGPPHTWIQGRLHAPSSAPPSNPAPLGTPQQISSKYDWPERETEAEMDRERESQRDRSRETEKGEEAAEREGDKSAACGQSPGHHTRRACGRSRGRQRRKRRGTWMEHHYLLGTFVITLLGKKSLYSSQQAHVEAVFLFYR